MATQIKPLVRAKAPRQSSLRREEAMWGLLLIAPSSAILLVFALLPILGSLGVSFTNWGGLSRPEWVGLDNYQKALTGDDKSLRYMLQTLIFTAVAVPLGLVASLSVASLIHNLKLPLVKSLFRTLYYLPMVTVGVATALLWKSLAAALGVNWLSQPSTVLPAVALFSVWQGAGSSIILFLAALANVPKELYEAAQLDGAKPAQLFRHITLPQISPTIFLVLILSLIGSLQVFEAVLFMTKGQPGDSSFSIAFYIYKTAFSFFRMGYATALSWLLAVALIVLLVLQWRIQRQWVYYE
jgi:multiple sugar transport system permease protein